MFIEPKFNHPLIINKLKLTPRELDILACVMSGRRGKTIASFLSISPKTVETHIRNIMNKFECNTQECIINFIEKSGKHRAIKERYLNILISRAFYKNLKEITLIVASKKISASVILYFEKEDETGIFIHNLEQHLKKSGITTTCMVGKSQQKWVKEDKESEAKVIYVFSEKTFTRFKEAKQEENFKEANCFKKAQLNVGKDIYILVGEGTENIPKSRSDVEYINFHDCQNYYLSFFELLSKLLPTLNLVPIIEDFEQQSSTIQGGNNVILLPRDDVLIKRASTQKISFLGRLSCKIKTYKAIVFVCLIFLVISIFIFASNEDDKIPPNGNMLKGTIRSDLPLPTEATLLQRSHLIKGIREKLNRDKGIQTVALVGIGGAGKTTLARQYACTQKSPVVWEINAETNESLINSFENLAYRLAKSDNEKKLLRDLQEIKSSEEREEKIRLFVKERLLFRFNWLLIYDNVGKFTDIQKYFPSDPNVWGVGKVIITTKDDNIRNNIYVNHCIHIVELNQQQKLDLFRKILYFGKQRQFNKIQEEKDQQFIERIPPFPLDVSLAAYYIKTTNISYEQYLKHLKNNQEDFANTQESILKEVSEYAKARYSIITLSLKQIINSHKDFGDLLLFISLLDSQDIPKNLLISYKNEIVVDSFIYHLKRYSLITNESFQSSLDPVISIHQMSQVISLSHLTKLLKLEKDKKLIKIIVGVLDNYIDMVIEKKDYLKMNNLIVHCESFLKHHALISDFICKPIYCVLGILLYYNSNYLKSKTFLEKSLENLSEDCKTASYALGYLGMVHRKLSNLEKAKTLLEKSLIISEKYFPENYKDVSLSLAHLGFVYKSLGNHEKAKIYLEKSLIIYRKHFSENDVRVAWLLNALGAVNIELCSFDKAESLFKQSLEIYKRQSPVNHMGIGENIGGLGVLYAKLGYYKEAKRLLEQALSHYKAYALDNYNAIARVYMQLGATCNRLNDYKQAKNFLEQSLIIYEKYVPDQIETALTLSHLGAVYRNIGNFKESKKLLKKSLAIYKEHVVEDSIRNIDTLANLGQTYLLENQVENAEYYFFKALRIFLKHPLPSKHRFLVEIAEFYSRKSWIVRNTGDIQLSQKLEKQALIYLKQAQEVIIENFPKNSPHLIRINATLKKLEKQ